MSRYNKFMASALRLLLPLLFALPLAAQETSPSATKKDESAPTNPADKYKVDGTAEKYRKIRDAEVMPWRVTTRELGQDTDLFLEELAYEDLLLHAAKFTHEELEAHARRDIPFGSLIGGERASFRLELVRFEGRLRRLLRVDVQESMKLQGIEAVYEAWVFPTQQSDPLCFFFTQLPPGLTPMKDVMKEELNRPVAITGYYFKLAKYEQMAFDRSQPGKHKEWMAPALIGRSITLLPEDSLQDAGVTWRMTFLPIIIGGVTAMALTLVYLSWRYRRGDRAILGQRDGRNQNPFEDTSSEPEP